ncbi:MAG: NFACT RNA binding domain-containing protein [Bacteroidota bacterium]
MHFHYYALRHLLDHLLTHHKGEKVLSAFSQNKNELILELEGIYLRIGCHTPQTYIVPVFSYAKARKNVVDLFAEIEGLTLEDGYVVPQERVMVLTLAQGYQLIFKMHGIMANVMLRHEDTIAALFNQQLEADWAYVDSPGPLQEDLLPEIELTDEKEILSHIREVSPIYEKAFAKRISELAATGLNLPQAYQKALTEAKNDLFYISKEGRKVKFYLFAPPHPAIEVKGVDEALRFFLRIQFQLAAYLNQYKTADKEIRKPVKKYQKVYDSYLKNIDQLENERNPEEIGHILMANLHAIAPNVKKVVLDDFYTDASITIKLDPQLNPQENAKRYYNKHKQRRARLLYLKEQMEDIENKLLNAEGEWEELQQLTPPDKLTLQDTGFGGEELKAMKQFSRQLRREMKEAEEEKSPFRHFRLAGYEIFVGKNARNNDELSFKYASKNDLWLHAKDVTGSHVIIRHRAGKDLPGEVLEYAAQLAAYYSKRKNDTLVPVQYTPRKYIRKRKGDPPGLVAVDREQVIMVEPVKA